MSEQEILPAQANEQTALDGRPIPGAALSAGSLIDMLEDGQFSADLYHQITELGIAISEVADATSNKAKGSLNIKIELVKEDNAFRIAAKFDVKKPEMPRPRSIMWTDEHNRFTRFPPNQTQMFGMRPVRSVG
jgi:hypothetical protein